MYKLFLILFWQTINKFYNIISFFLKGEPLQVLEFSIVRRSDYVLKNFYPVKGVKIFEAS